MGFPESVPNGFASPIFTSSLLYGLGGMFLISFFFALLMASLCKKITLLLEEKSSNLFNPIFYAKVFIICDAIVMIMQKYYLDGNIEILKDFSVQAVALILVLIKENFFSKRRVFYLERV